jgi:hypothetical protein
MRRTTTILLALAVPGLGLARDELSGVITDRLAASKAWDYNVSIFEKRVEALFDHAPAGLRAELVARLRWARRQVEAENRALDEVRASLAALAEAPLSHRGGGARSEALKRASRAVDAYAGLHDEAVLRAVGRFPSSAAQRLVARYQRRGEDRLLLPAEAALRREADGLVRRISRLMEGRRRVLYETVRDLQYSKEALDLIRLSQLDRAFGVLQAASAHKLEPSLWHPAYEDFPVQAPLAPTVPFRLASSVAALEPPPYPGRAPEPVPGLSEEGLGREAHRMKELHDLRRNFAATLSRRDDSRLDELWTAWVAFRKRWYGGG